MNDGALSRHIGAHSTIAAYGKARIQLGMLVADGEVAVRRGDSFGARRYLRELTTHYPEVGVSEEIIDVFLATDLTTVVNLRG